MRVDPVKVVQFAIDNVDIENKRGGEPVAFEPNEGQRLLVKSRAAHLDKAWLCACKTRQVGSTTFWLVYIACLCVLYPGISIAFVAPDDVLEGPIESKWIVIINSLMQNMGSEFPHIRVNNRKKFELVNGSVIQWVRSGKTKKKATEAGIGSTVNLLILSEFAKFPFAQVTLRAIKPALEQSQGAVIIDSSPPDIPGIGQEYIDICRDALSGNDESKEFFFWPWYIEKRYRAATPAEAPFDESEQWLMKDKGVDLYQLQWRREQKASDEIGDAFPVIYLEDPISALIPRTETLFDPDIILKYRRMSLEDYPAPFDGDSVYSLLTEELRPEPNRKATDHFLQSKWGESYVYPGIVRIWEPPVKGEKYTIGVDSSQGFKRGDAQAAVVLSDRTGEMVASIHGRWSVMAFSSLVQRMATLFNMAVIEIEFASTGAEVMWNLTKSIPKDDCVAQRAHEILFIKYPKSKCIKRAATQAARIARTEAAKDMVNSGVEIKDPALYRELENIDPESGRAPARSHDDYFDAWGIAKDSQKKRQVKKAKRDVEARYGLKRENTTKKVNTRLAKWRSYR